MLQSKIALLSTQPGCYLYKDQNGVVIYVGKAKCIKKRVMSYFSHTTKDDKTLALIKEIADIDIFVTGNEVEALILENNLIKKHKPKYNIDLKDSERYAFILVTDEVYPRLITARQRKAPGNYFGPFVCAEARELILQTLRTSFKIRTCKKLPKKACLRYHIGLCSAPCIGAISQQEYATDVKNAVQYLKGQSTTLIGSLKEEMKDKSRMREYERAKVLRDRINSLESLDQKQRFQKVKKFDEDIMNYIVSENIVYVVIFNVIQGMLATKKEFSFAYTDEWREEFLLQYYAEHEVPKMIILPFIIEDQSLLSYLELRRGGKVSILVPKKGEKAQLLDIVKRNIEATFLNESKELNSLREALSLNFQPNVIECFDISHTQGTNSVASMVQFRSGVPDKSHYRRFKIRTVIGSNDIASIKEVVKRRYVRLHSEGTPFPDLIVIDGGSLQLASALQAIEEIGVKIPMIGLAKKFEEIYLPGKEQALKLHRDTPGLKLLIKIRNEAHRFALTYHRLRRSKNMLGKQ